MTSADERSGAKAPKESRPATKKMTRVRTLAHSNNGHGASVGDPSNPDGSKMDIRRADTHGREPRRIQPVLAGLRCWNFSAEAQSGLARNARAGPVSELTKCRLRSGANLSHSRRVPRQPGSARHPGRWRNLFYVRHRGTSDWRIF